MNRVNEERNNVSVRNNSTTRNVRHEVWKNTYGLLGRRSECGGTSGKSGDNSELHFDFIYIKTGM